MNRTVGLLVSALSRLFSVAPLRAATDAKNVTIGSLSVNTPTGNVVFIRVSGVPVGSTLCANNTY